jgi:3-phenylpropionate/trans-cinnamate dioxygenase ferredoxin reductase component
MPDPRQVDVLLMGGGVAAVRCARTLRRAGFDGTILLVGEEPVPPYNRPPLSKELLREALPDDLVHAEPAPWYERRSVMLETGTPVVALDPGRHEATLLDGRRVRYGRALLATGAAPRALSIPGGATAPTLRTIADARRIAAAADAAGRAAPAVVVGGGLIGVEVASSLAALGLRPTIVERAAQLWGGALGEELETWARGRLNEAGVEVLTQVTVEGIGPDAVRAAGRTLPSRVTVVGVGVWPRIELGRSAGIDMEDGVQTDAAGRTSARDLWAAGDVARVAGRRVEHWHAAREGGERAARSMLGLPVEPVPPPWTFTEVAGTSIDVVGDPSGWDRERWAVDGRLLVHESGGRAVRIVAVEAALDAATMRRLVADGATFDEVRSSAVAA